MKINGSPNHAVTILIVIFLAVIAFVLINFGG